MISQCGRCGLGLYPGEECVLDYNIYCQDCFDEELEIRQTLTEEEDMED